MKPGLLILMVCCSPLDFIQRVENEIRFSQRNKKDLDPAGNGGDKSEKKEKSQAEYEKK